MTYDVVVKGGRIVDGTGKAAYGGDVAIAGRPHRRRRRGRVARPSRDDRRRRPGRRPGLHRRPHALRRPAAVGPDGESVDVPTASRRSCIGNCGYTLAPVRADDQDYLMGLFAAAEEIPKEALQRSPRSAWETFPDYLDWLDGRIGVNVVTQVGPQRGAPLRDGRGRARAGGHRRTRSPRWCGSSRRRSTPAPPGISSSQAPHQRGELGEHIPSFFADDAETDALAEAVRRKGEPPAVDQPGDQARRASDEDDQALLVELAEISGAVVSWNDFGMGTPERRRARSSSWRPSSSRASEIYAIARCQRAETRFTLKKLSGVFATSEPWVELSRLDPADKLAALARSDVAGAPRRVLGHRASSW